MPKRQRIESDSFPKRTTFGERLSHLAFVAIDTNLNTSFSAMMTRIPCVGEYIFNHGETYKVTAVYHNLMLPDGKSNSGYAAFLDVEHQPEPEEQKRLGKK